MKSFQVLSEYGSLELIYIPKVELKNEESFLINAGFSQSVWSLNFEYLIFKKK